MEVTSVAIWIRYQSRERSQPPRRASGAHQRQVKRMPAAAVAARRVLSRSLRASRAC
jgi:hypothetical protein